MPAWSPRAALAVLTAAVLVGCAGPRLQAGVYHSPDGYRVAVPGRGWHVVEETRADLELRQDAAPAAMLANATCDPAVARRRPGVLQRHLWLGLRDVTRRARDEATVGGHPAAHEILEGRMDGSRERVQIESYVVKGDRCVWDLLYVAPPAAFPTWQPDFHRFVESFGTE